MKLYMDIENGEVLTMPEWREHYLLTAPDFPLCNDDASTRYVSSKCYDLMEVNADTDSDSGWTII